MSYDQSSDDLEQVKQTLKARFSPTDYEGLIEYAAELYISNRKRKKEMDDFRQAMLGIRLTKADDNKKAQKWIEETFKHNSLFKDFKLVNLYSGKFRSWGMNAKRHASDRKAKKIVLSWWQDDKEKSNDKDKMVILYQTRLRKMRILPACNTNSKTERREEDEEESYSFETISRWLAKK